MYRECRMIHNKPPVCSLHVHVAYIHIAGHILLHNYCPTLNAWELGYKSTSQSVKGCVPLESESHSVETQP